jgi:16S rRNA (cytosine967-C5)-methyltransferase
VSGPAPARRAAWHALLGLRADDRPPDGPLSLSLGTERLEERDRRLAMELVAGTLKRRLSLDTVLASFSSVPLARVAPGVLEALRLGAFQLLYLERVPAHAAVGDSVALVASEGRKTRGFVNAVLRAVAREGRERLDAAAGGDGPQSLAVRWSCPVWMVSLLVEDLGREAAEALLAAADRTPERCLRVNRLRADLRTAEAALAAAGFSVAGVSGLPDALLYDGPPLEASPAFAAGLVTAQSRGSQLAGIVAAGALAAPDALLDLCAAPGTKTAQLAAAHPRARLVAVDVDEARAAGLRANLTRLGADRVEIVTADAGDLSPSFAGAFDTVLVDAPCTGLGTLGTRADLRWRRRAGDVARLAGEQRRLLAAGARCVRPGGALTYAVCTVTQAETLAVVDGLLAGGGWALDDLGAAFPEARHPANGACLLALPPSWGSTGFFVARLRRGPVVAATR